VVYSCLIQWIGFNAVYDYLVVGAGLSGATFAQCATEAGKTCLVVDRRNHIAGNCYTAFLEDSPTIPVHMYGPHIFHTNSEYIWKYVCRFAEFLPYQHTVVADLLYQGMVSMPINLATLSHLFGISTPAEAARYFLKVQEPDAVGHNVEDWCLRTIGRPLYDMLIHGYTYKQWNTDPKELPESIIRRLPVRYTFDTRYFEDRFQGIPIHGYTVMISHMLQNVEVLLQTDFHASGLQRLANRIVYTGPIDELYHYDMGRLPYRSIQLDHTVVREANVQGTAQVNYPHDALPYTRSVEPVHFLRDNVVRDRSVISLERSVAVGEPAYPINTDDNNLLALQYMRRAEDDGYIICGRMARYQYYNMDQAIAQALKVATKELQDV
jgi:UDP-galactopyranose mutase